MASKKNVKLRIMSPNPLSRKTGFSPFMIRVYKAKNPFFRDRMRPLQNRNRTVTLSEES